MEVNRLRPLREFTDARIALGRAGASLRTPDWLALREAHAAARDAIGREMTVPAGETEVRSRCRSRQEYLLRPDLGRRLDEGDRERIPSGPFDVAVVIADGLSPLAVDRHALATLEATSFDGLAVSPPVYVRAGRVAIGDEIGELAQARLAIVLIGERPGLSAADSLGIYITYAPRIGRTDAERNCISNIRDGGLSYEEAGRRAAWIVHESLRRELSGVDLKEAACLQRQSQDDSPRPLLYGGK
jgi:ethanolamine ammonia-lyase small subunit